MLKHNKKKNSGIVYEQLMMLMATLLSENKKEEVAYVKSIVCKHFNKDSSIFKEKKILDQLLKFRTSDVEEAKRFLGECLAEAAVINFEKLEKEKVKLINEIVSNLGGNVFNIPVKNYKLLASSQFLLNETRNNFKHSLAEERLKLKKLIIENLCKEEVVTEQTEEPVDNLTMKILKKKYIKKYTSSLSENQQIVLAKFNNYLNSNDEKKFLSFLKEQYGKIYKNIHSFLALNQDYENAPLLKEACNKIKQTQIVTVNEDVVYEIMRFWDVVDDLKLEDRGINQ